MANNLRKVWKAYDALEVATEKLFCELENSNETGDDRDRDILAVVNVQRLLGVIEQLLPEGSI